MIARFTMCFGQNVSVRERCAVILDWSIYVSIFSHKKFSRVTNKNQEVFAGSTCVVYIQLAIRHLNNYNILFFVDQMEFRGLWNLHMLLTHNYAPGARE